MSSSPERRPPKRGWNPSLWAGLAPNGIGQVKPNHYLEMAKVAWQNRDQLPYAWRILTQGVCDGCALGTSGLSDYTMDGVHLCAVRLQLMRLNTAPALDPRRLEDVRSLESLSGKELRALGRLPYPMIRRRGESGYRRATWDEALDAVADRLRTADPNRVGFYLTSRGITNEVYYAASKVARFLGTNHVDNSARLCHAPSTVVLKEMIGAGASTCSYTDWLESDLIVFFGSHTPNNQPVTTKYLYYAKQNGTRVAVVNPYREPGLERYWVPSVLESALFGTRLADEWYELDIGGDAAFLSGALKALVEAGGVDRAFVDAHTTGFDDVASWARGLTWADLEQGSGATRARMKAFAEMIAQAKSAVFVWSMGLTQHAHGADNIRALVNLALARGFVGRAGAGLMPIRGHSGVQGGAEVGAVPGALSSWAPLGSPAAEQFGRAWGFAIPTLRGLSAVEMIDAAGEGALDVLYSLGGNFLETLPEPERVRAALARVPLRVHHDIVLSSQMLVEPADLAVILPGQTRYEQAGGGTETSTERRILFSPEVRGRRIGESRSDWEILTEVAARAYPARAEQIRFANAAAIRAEIARLIPMYAGIETLSKKGDQVQYGGRWLCQDGHFPLEGGRAHFRIPFLAEEAPPPGHFRLATRRGKQFNSMVQAERDPLNGAGRDAVLLSAHDAQALGVRHGEAIVLRSRTGMFRGRVFVSPIKPGNVQVHFPEANGLLDLTRRENTSGIPDYGTLVTIERASANGSPSSEERPA
ncbi:MAG TPA: FdhF/YdeP family oxidoreductase [Candidatus Eisenbacteria bacterium]|nr:FdhF/YdeP family oxidoreductase [Candidatus Eisenbacteria bacterium]